MKHIIIIILTLIALNSCTNTFIPCQSESKPGQAVTSLMPVAEGNEWIYERHAYDLKGNVTDSSRRDVKIGPPDTLFYKDDNLDKQYVHAYRVISNGNPVIYSYIVCGQGAIYVEEYGYSPGEIFTGRTIPNDIQNGWVDPRNEDIVWKGPVKVTVPAGTFDCWVCEFVLHKNQKSIYREYYSRGIGLVKVEELNRKDRILATLELTKYNLRESVN